MKAGNDVSLIKGSVVLVLALVLLAACGGPSPTSSPAIIPSTSVTDEPSVTPPEASNQIVTLDNAGQTIMLKTGESFLLKLGEEYDWAVTIADQSVISRVKNVMVVRGAQGLYEANKAGSTTLTASGDPVCRQSQPPCAMPSRLFEIKVEVK